MTRKSAFLPIKSRQNSPLDYVARWLGRRSQLSRSIIAGLVALAITGALGLIIYGFLLGLPVSSLQFGSFQPNDLITALLVVLSIIGLALYWIGWRILIGFDFGEKPLQPGRPAAAWVLVGLAVLIVTVIVAVINALIAMSPS